MTTLSISKAQANLPDLLEKAKRGEDIGIMSGDQIVALRPVTVSSDDYAWREYGVTAEQMERVEKRVERDIKRGRNRGRVKRFSGDLEKDLAD